MANSWDSDHQHERPLHLARGALLSCCGFGLLTLAAWHDWRWLVYAALFPATAGAFACIPLAVTWGCESFVLATDKSVAAAVIVGCGNLGGIAGPLIYGTLFRAGHHTALARGTAPAGAYRLGHACMAGVCAAAAALTLVLRAVLHPPGARPPRSAHVQQAAEAESLLRAR